MHATGTDFADLDDDLRLVTLPDAARFLSVSRGSLYDLLTTGQLASVHIGRSRRITDDRDTPGGRSCKACRLGWSCRTAVRHHACARACR